MTETDKLIFSRMAFYITECADFITPEMMREMRYAPYEAFVYDDPKLSFDGNILPQFPCRDKIRLICADALEYAKNENEADYVFADIWHDPTDGIALMLELKKHERKNCRYLYWIEDTMKLYM